MDLRTYLPSITGAAAAWLGNALRLRAQTSGENTTGTTTTTSSSSSSQQEQQKLKAVAEVLQLRRQVSAYQVGRGELVQKEQL